MLREIDPHVMKPEKSGLIRRWLRDAEKNCDVFIWTDASGTIKRFQFWSGAILLEWQSGIGLRTGNADMTSGGFVSLQAASFQYHFNAKNEVLEAAREKLTGMINENPEHHLLLDQLLKSFDDGNSGMS
jgi:hypothetical protein